MGPGTEGEDGTSHSKTGERIMYKDEGTASKGLAAGKSLACLRTYEEAV